MGRYNKEYWENRTKIVTLALFRELGVKILGEKEAMV